VLIFQVALLIVSITGVSQFPDCLKRAGAALTMIQLEDITMKNLRNLMKILKVKIAVFELEGRVSNSRFEPVNDMHVK